MAGPDYRKCRVALFPAENFRLLAFEILVEREEVFYFTETMETDVSIILEFEIPRIPGRVCDDLLIADTVVQHLEQPNWTRLANPAVELLAGASATTTLVPPFFTATAENGELPAAFLQDFHNLGAQSGRGLLPGKGVVLLLRGDEQNPVVFAMSPTYSLVALTIFVLLAWFVVTRLTRKRSVERRPLWAGGIPRLLPQMTYTATGFSSPVRVVFQSIFQPNITEDTRQTVAVHFRAAIHRQREETHAVDRAFLRPVRVAARWMADSLARMHHGRLNAYVMYVFGFLLLILFLYRVT